MKYRHVVTLCIMGVTLTTCQGTSVVSVDVPTDVRVFHAPDLDNRQINFVWIETPSDLILGSNKVRVFMARTNPPGMLVPTETELPCLVQGEKEYLDLRPVMLEFDFDGEQLFGSYMWNACASCIECYMDWDTTMEINAMLAQEQMEVSIGIRHMGHNIQDKFVQFQLQEQAPSKDEPRILCRRSFDCKDVELVPRR